MQRQDLERMTREQLIAHAERLGIQRPRVLTQPELVDEIIGRTTNDRDRTRARGWLGRARDLLAKVVERGLHLPEAARVLRQEEKSWPAPPPPLPTVTLAEIYAAQGHLERAITVLDEVLAREPDHREARSLRERFVEQRERARARAGRIEAPPAPPPAPPAKETKSAKPKEAAPKAPEAKAKAEEATSAPADASEAAPPGSDETGTIGAATSDERAEETDAIAGDALAEPELVDAIASTERAPAQVIEEPPLPSRYEVDEVVAIAVDPRTIYIYWEVRPTTLSRAQAAHPEGQMCLRIASITASWEGPVVDTRDLHVDALYGDRFVRDVQPGSNVRASIGWKSSAGFEPLAVGAEVTAPRAVPVESVAEDVARWEEGPAPMPFAAWRPEEGRPAIARTVEQHVIDPFVPRRASIAPWPPSSASKSAVHGAPIDTGFAIWGEPAANAGEVVGEREIVVEESWFVSGGSSELSRGGPGRTIRVSQLVPGAPPRIGGASELYRGGASELYRGGASELGR